MGTRHLYIPGFDQPRSVRYELPQGWDVHHPSGATNSGDVWTYPSHEIPLDTPVVVGRFDLVTRFAGPDKKTPIYGLFATRGVGFEEEVDGFADKPAAVADKFYSMFGFFPFDDHTFVMTLNPLADWGLEHLGLKARSAPPGRGRFQNHEAAASA